MKIILRIVICAVFITAILALNASAIYELQNEFDVPINSYYEDGLESDSYALYRIGSWWFLDDAEARTVITNQTGYIDLMGGHVYAEVKNGYDGNHDEDTEYGFDHVRTCEISVSIDDIYATYTHHECDFYYNNIYRYSGNYTAGEKY